VLRVANGTKRNIAATQQSVAFGVKADTQYSAQSNFPGPFHIRMLCEYAGENDAVFANARNTAEQIPSAVFAQLPGLNHPEAFFHAADLITPRAREFLSAQTEVGPL
jgi:hypothetical protein